MKMGSTAFISALTVIGISSLTGPASAADPTIGECLTASDASLKFANEHKLRAERTQLLICAAASCPADIRKECVQRVDEINRAIPSIVFEVKDSAGRDLSTVKITMDGELLAKRLEGSALLIDPGEHSFIFETAGQPPLEKRLLIRESQKDRREVITLGQVGPQTPATQPLQSSTKAPADASALSASVTTTPSPSLPPDTDRRSSIGPQRVAALIVGGIGGVGVGVGSFFGLQAMSRKNTAQNICPNLCTDTNGQNKWHDAKTSGNISTVAFIVGGVGLAGAATLWFTGKPESMGSPEVGLGPNSIQLRGNW